MNRLKLKLLSYFETRGRRIRNTIYRIRLKNKNFSIISSNCNGGVMAHDLGVKFNTPFINVGFHGYDFVKLLQNPKYYLYECELVFVEPWVDGDYIKSTEDKFPVAMLGDLALYFPHDKSEESVRNNWNKRKSRINWDNLFIVFTNRDSCSYEDMVKFDGLPYKNKIIFTHKPYPEIASAVYIRGFEDQDSVGVLSDYKGSFGKRYLDEFDYVTWLNKVM